MQLSAFITTALLSSAVSAHFQLTYPGSLGFDEDVEANAPCGGQDIKFADNDTSVPVDGFPVALSTEHPQGKFSYRATLNQTAPYTWVELLGVTETGLGNFCLPNLRVPSNWTGNSGLIQVVADLGDGTLYQCAAVKFVNGSTASIDSNVCKNGTVTATVTSNGNATTSSGSAAAGSSSPSGTGTASSATPTTSKSAASNLMGSAFFAGLGAAVIALGAL